MSKQSEVIEAIAEKLTSDGVLTKAGAIKKVKQVLSGRGAVIVPREQHKELLGLLREAIDMVWSIRPQNDSNSLDRHTREQSESFYHRVDARLKDMLAAQESDR